MSDTSWLPAELQSRRPRILVVDDQVINVRLLHELFKDDCDVLMATSGQLALSVCSAQLPDLVLLDVMMPDIDGHEVCRLLKLDPATRDIPVIFITGQHGEEDEVAGFALGAVDFISKPINPIIVRARVHTHLLLKLQSDKIRSMAMSDGLTGIANRRKFDGEAERCWRHCLRELLPLSIFMIDVDYFKRYNDRYGHQNGDNCLHAIAQTLHSILQRPYDVAARYGGEEFACVLGHTDARGAEKIAAQ
ncbi:MAG TPA: diguanylate cyclase, partial [Spongiibacteraceae bacterium]|nr:diguanylate cyclase [Spongiibacteraceae bacterium]